MDLGLHGRRVLITGASRGLGRAIAVAFADEGTRVVLVARDESRLETVVAELAGDGPHSYVAIDLQEPGVPTKVAHDILRDGPVDVVVHNLGGPLGVNDPLAPFEEWARVWRHNLGVAIELNAALVPPMRERGWGRVIHVSSSSAEHLRGSMPYATSKAHLNAYVQALGRALIADGIVVSAIVPGAFIAPGNHWDRLAREETDVLADYVERYEPLGRIATPDQIAPFALFLASEQAALGGGVVSAAGGSM